MKQTQFCAGAFIIFLILFSSPYAWGSGLIQHREIIRDGLWFLTPNVLNKIDEGNLAIDYPTNDIAVEHFDTYSWDDAAAENIQDGYEEFRLRWIQGSTTQFKGNVIPVAHAAPTLKLYITPTSGGQYLVKVIGLIEHREGQDVLISLKGSDTFYDDHLLTLNSNKNPPVKLEGGRFDFTKIVPGSILNEDWGRDEVYASIRITGLNSVAVGMRSNTVTGNY